MGWVGRNNDHGDTGGYTQEEMELALYEASLNEWPDDRKNTKGGTNMPRKDGTGPDGKGPKKVNKGIPTPKRNGSGGGQGMGKGRNRGPGRNR